MSNSVLTFRDLFSSREALPHCPSEHPQVLANAVLFRFLYRSHSRVKLQNFFV